MNSPQEEKNDSPESDPNCLSEVSLDRLIKFNKNQNLPQKRRSQENAQEVKPELSVISVSSKDEVLNFNHRSHFTSATNANKPLSLECSAVSEDQHTQQTNESLEHIFKNVGEDIISFVKNQLNEFLKILSGDSTEEQKENVEGCRDAEHRRCNRDACLIITKNFMRERKLEQLIDYLEKKVSSPSNTKFKSNLKLSSEYVYEGIPKAGNETLLHAIYTELNITEGETEEVNIQHEVRLIQAPSRKGRKEETPIRCENIFEAPAGRDKPVRTVMMKGVAGIGKTMLTRKFTVAWCEGQANQDIDYIFPLPFRKLNFLGKKKYSLVSLIHEFFPDIKDDGIGSLEGFQVLFILDGLDEWRVPLEFSFTELVTDVTVSTTVDVLLINLIRGTLLPSALLWITTRPAAASQILPEYVDRVTEVRGFTDQQKEEYFKKRFKCERQFLQIMSHIEMSRSLHIMCHIPVFCWIMATVLENMLENSKEQKLPKTLTEMYIHFLNVQARVMKDKYDSEVQTDQMWSQQGREMIMSLDKLAFEQLLKGELNFYKSDLKNCGIDLNTASVSSGVFTQIFKEERGLYEKKLFCFVHLSVQEFLAALHVHVTFTDSGVNLLVQQQTGSQEAETQQHESTETSLYQSAVDMALQSPNGHLDLFLRFLLGLSMPENKKLLAGLLMERESALQTNQEAIKYIKQKLNKDLHPERSINLFHCLNELNDDSLEKEIQEYLTAGCLCTDELSSALWSALVFLLLSSGHVDVFDLKKYSGSKKAFYKLLQVLKASDKALLSGCSLSEKNCEDLSFVLSSQMCNLRTLDLSNNDLRDSGVLLLCEGLQNSSCKLETLRLSGCLITEAGCASLASALTSNPSHLQELDVRHNNLGEAGVKLLSDLKENPSIQLKILRLYPTGSKWLTPGLKKYACKVTLDPNTAHRCLYLYDDNTKMIPLESSESCHDHPERYNSWPQVRSGNALSGRCYWEIEWKGEAHIAVTYKLDQTDISSCFGMNTHSWSLDCCSNVFYAWHNKSSATICPPDTSSPSNRVGVYLDWEAGTLSFYRVSSEVPIHLHTFNTTFTDSVYPGFGFGEGRGNSLTICKLEE